MCPKCPEKQWRRQPTREPGSVSVYDVTVIEAPCDTAILHYFFAVPLIPVSELQSFRGNKASGAGLHGRQCRQKAVAQTRVARNPFETPAPGGGRLKIAQCKFVRSSVGKRAS
jgi:hypothetical protein